MIYNHYMNLLPSEKRVWKFWMLVHQFPISQLIIRTKLWMGISSIQTNYTCQYYTNFLNVLIIIRPIDHIQYQIHLLYWYGSSYLLQNKNPTKNFIQNSYQILKFVCTIYKLFFLHFTWFKVGACYDDSIQHQLSS